MRVLFYAYPSAFQNPGGGEVQLLKTFEYLKKSGVIVKKFDMWQDKLSDYDILHVFGSVKECLSLMQAASSKGSKVALSTIFWSDYKRSAHEEAPLVKRLDYILRHTAKACFPFFPSERRKMMQAADILFPNGEGEASQIKRYFGIPNDKIFVVPNGVDERFKDATADAFVKKFGFTDFVLYAGRIEPRKNQLTFIRAMKHFDKPIVFLGDPVGGYEEYFKRCKQEAAANMHFLGNIPHDSDLLSSAYAACGVFALTSWFETPGLSALEAAASGARIVITEGGCTREYFKDLALYVRPDSQADIRASIEKAYTLPKSDLLKQDILKHYTWDKVAEATKKGYERILNR